MLRNNNIPLLGIVFNGEENMASKKVILEMGQTTELGTLPQLHQLTATAIKKAANDIRLERSISL